jgi:AbrB family looped-hinge helix DNA binding protein
MSVHKTRVDRNGRIVIPAEVRRRLGVEPGDEVVLDAGPHEVRLSSHQAALGDPERLTELVRRLDLEVVPADLSQAVGAARLHAANRAQDLALADCFCLGLALARKAEVLTAGRVWLAVRVGVPVTLVR